MNILVIDSDRVGRRLAALLIGRLDYPPPTFAETVDAAPAGDWSLVLVDVGDFTDGLPALRRRFGVHTRLAAMLVTDDGPMRDACLQAGADEVLAKPLTRESLAQLCTRAAPVVDDFDPAAWTELRELFGASGVAELCAALVDDLPVQQARLADAVREQDLAALKRLAHALRGVSLQLGATALAGQWTSVEQAAAGDGATAQRLGADLMGRYAALVARVCDEARGH